MHICAIYWCDIDLVRYFNLSKHSLMAHTTCGHDHTKYNMCTRMWKELHMPNIWFLHNYLKFITHLLANHCIPPIWPIITFLLSLQPFCDTTSRIIHFKNPHNNHSTYSLVHYSPFLFYTLYSFKLKEVTLS